MTTLLRIWLRIRQYKKAFREASRGAGFYGPESRREAEETRQYVRGGWTYPLRRKRKVFARDEGEYVSFKEVKVTSQSEPPVYRETVEEYRRTRVYQRITDAEWEEV